MYIYIYIYIYITLSCLSHAALGGRLDSEADHRSRQREQ